MTDDRQIEREMVARRRADVDVVHRQIVTMFDAGDTRLAALAWLARSIREADSISQRLWGVVLDVRRSKITLNVGAVWSVNLSKRGMALLVLEDRLDDMTWRMLAPRFKPGQRAIDNKPGPRQNRRWSQ